jgi:hypothetical protein
VERVDESVGDGNNIQLTSFSTYGSLNSQVRDALHSLVHCRYAPCCSAMLRESTVAVEWLALLRHIPEVPFLDVDLETGFLGFPHSVEFGGSTTFRSRKFHSISF